MTVNYLNSAEVGVAEVSQALIGRYGILNPWVEDLVAVADNPQGHKTSFLAGRAVMIECRDISACRQLLPQVAQMAGMRYLTPKAEEVGQWLGGENDLLMTQDLGTPTLAYIPIECFIKSGEKSSKNEFGWDVPSWLELTQSIQEINQKTPLVIVTVGKEFLDISDELRAAYAFDRYFTIPKATPIERANEFIEEVGVEHLDKSITQFPEKVGMLVNMRFPDKRRLGLLVMAIKRLAFRNKRRINYKDLVRLAAIGTGERTFRPHAHEKNRYRTAVHEAGHVLIAMVDSGGKNVPDYVSILRGEGFLGLTLEAYEYHYQQIDCDEYRIGRHSVRLALGGRAAEEVVLGIEQIGTSGLRSDLEEVSSITRGFFAVHGVGVNMEGEEHTGTNLAAIVNSESTSEAAHIESLMREFIERQYCTVLEMVKLNRDLLDRIVAMLLAKEEIYQDDLQPFLSELVKRA
jgi:hypothetical protein